MEIISFNIDTIQEYTAELHNDSLAPGCGEKYKYTEADLSYLSTHFGLLSFHSMTQLG